MDKKDALDIMDILIAREIGLTAHQWKTMYITVMSAASRALDVLPLNRQTAQAYSLLHNALEEAEEYYINSAREEDQFWDMPDEEALKKLNEELAADKI